MANEPSAVSQSQVINDSKAKKPALISALTAKLAVCTDFVKRSAVRCKDFFSKIIQFICTAVRMFASEVKCFASVAWGYIKVVCPKLASFVSKLFGKKKNENTEPSQQTPAGDDLPTPDNNARGKRFVLSLVSISLALLTLASSVLLGVTALADDGRISVTLNCDGAETTYTVREMSVSELLELTGTELDPEDTVSAELTSALTDGQTVVVTRAVPVVVIAKDQVHVIKLADGTVSDALKAANIDYSQEDEISYLPFDDIQPGMVINYANVEIAYNTTYRTLEHEEIVQEDPNWYEGNQEVLVEGSDGKKQITQRVIIRDGKEISRRVVDQVVLTPAVDRVLRVGTKIRLQTSLRAEWRRWRAAPTPDMIKEVMYVECTAYTHTGNQTAMGTWPCLGTMAVNPRRIPYYSKIYVPGYGYGTALDTGGFRFLEGGMFNLIDLFMDTAEECFRWGRKRNYKVYVLQDWVYVPRHP